MISFYLKNNEYQFPNQWEELTPCQYKTLVSLLQQYSSGKLSVSDVKVLWLVDIAGITGMKINRKKKDMFSENIYRMSREFTFIFDIEYPDGSLDNISPNLRKKLKTTPPEDLEQTPEVRYISRLDYQYKIAACWCKNLLPDITIGELKLKGYQLNLRGKMLHTSLVASQFNFATELLQQYEVEQNNIYLRMLVATLYAPAKENFNTDTVANIAEELVNIDNTLLNAVLLNFQALITFIKLKTKWGLLWKRKPSKAGGLSVGADDTLHNLTERNFGDFEKIERLPLTKFFDIMLKDLYDSVKQMKEYDMDIAEISSKSGLTINQVKRILS